MVDRGVPVVPHIPGAYEPSPWQISFHQARVDELLGAGAAGPGKSLCLLMDPLDIILVEQERMRRKGEADGLPPGGSVARILFVRRELNMLSETVDRALRIFPLVDPGVKYRNEGKHIFTFSSGAKYLFGGCKDENDWTSYQGDQYVWIGFDEAPQFAQVQYSEIQARLRTSDPILAKLLRVRLAGNPAPGWVRDYFVDPHPQGKRIIRKKSRRPDGTEVETTRLYLPATLYDNPDKAFVAQYEKKLLSLPITQRNAYLKGDWYATADSFYADDWDGRVHVIRPFKAPAYWPAFRSMDWGFKTHGVIYWWKVSPDEDLIAIKEYSFRKKTAGAVAEEVKRIEKELGLWNKATNRSAITGPADTQLWEARGETAVTKAEEMARKGVPWLPANKKSRSGNALRFIQRLRDRSGDFPGICFFDTCRNAIRTIPSMPVDPDDTEQPLKTAQDHWHDAVLYACAHRLPRFKDDDDDTFETPEERRRHRESGGESYTGALPWT